MLLAPTILSNSKRQEGGGMKSKVSSQVVPWWANSLPCPMAFAYSFQPCMTTANLSAEFYQLKVEIIDLIDVGVLNREKYGMEGNMQLSSLAS